MSLFRKPSKVAEAIKVVSGGKENIIIDGKVLLQLDGDYLISFFIKGFDPTGNECWIASGNLSSTEPYPFHSIKNSAFAALSRLFK